MSKNSKSNLKAEVVLIGDSSLAILIAAHLIVSEVPFILINPHSHFDSYDLRPHDGLGLWQAAYRADKTTASNSLSHYYDLLVDRLQQFYPGSAQTLELQKLMVWTALSATPIHASATHEFEKVFYRLEKRDFAQSFLRLLSREHSLTLLERMRIKLGAIADIEASMQQDYGIVWNHVAAHTQLLQFLNYKAQVIPVLKNFSIDKCVGKKIIGRYKGCTVHVEATSKVIVALNGSLLPSIRPLLLQNKEPWVQGLRRRRVEYQVLELERDSPHESSVTPFWLQLGEMRFLFQNKYLTMNWSVKNGPDSIEHGIDEVFRLERNLRLFRMSRYFSLAWDWKTPQWRKSKFDYFWATSFEGSLWNMLDLVAKTPV